MTALAKASPEIDLASCHREPIHTPGAIQPHGVLIAADAADFRVTHVSANFADSTGLPALSVLGAPLSAIVGTEAWAQLCGALGSERYAGTNVMTLDFAFALEPRRNAVVHAWAGHIIIELEPASSAEDQFHVVSRVQTIMAGLRELTTIVELSDRIAESLRGFTGYDRVMVYRFDVDGHGEVIAESRRDDLEAFLHLRYPASDIPSQARRLYIKQRVRVIADVAYRPVTLLAAADAADAMALDMSYCGLRSISPLHIEYLQNMGVGATLAISLVQDDALWGMIVCHHQTAFRVSADVSALCDLLGQLGMLLISRAGEREELGRVVERQDLLAQVKQAVDRAPSVLAGLVPMSANLLSLMAAAGAAVRVGGQVHLFGATPSPEQVTAILDDLRGTSGDEVMAVDGLSRRFPQHAPVAAEASGALFLPLLNNPGDAIVWFRPEITRTVIWGGNPSKPVTLEGNPVRISPRKSFAAWRELQRGLASPWTTADVRSAQEVRRIVTDGLLRHAEASLARLSSTDPLTGLANRRQIETALNVWSSTPSRQPAALLFVDLDRFKTINDSLGHAAGDALLIQVAQRLLRSAPVGCLVARLGGDEFVAFLEGPLADQAEPIATAMLRAFDTPFNVAGRPHRASGSIGIARSGPGGGDLLSEADAAMYAAKRQGSGRAVVFETILQETAMRALRTEQDMFLAIQREEFLLHYQPIVDVADGALLGFEALVRWRHPERGWISPAEFIPLAEDTGLIITLGRWIMETGVAELARWSGGSLMLSINVSPRQLGSAAFADHLRQALHRAGVGPARVTIEVTEGALMDRAAVAQLRGLREIGCRIAIDDFGTGYSSLAYLRELSIDVIKIDRGFVTPLGLDAKADLFFEALVGLARTLDLAVVAEGVETEEQLGVVRGAACHAVQGYLFSKPLPVEGLPAYIARSVSAAMSSRQPPRGRGRMADRRQRVTKAGSVS